MTVYKWFLAFLLTLISIFSVVNAQCPNGPCPDRIRRNSGKCIVLSDGSIDCTAAPGKSITIATSDGGNINITPVGGGTVNINGTPTPGGGITSLNLLTGAAQTFSTGTAGSDFAIVSVGTDHQFRIPDAGVSVRGLVSTTTQTFDGPKTFNNNITLQGPGTSFLITNSPNTEWDFASGSGARVANSVGFSFSSTATTGGAKDVGIARHAAGIIAINNGTIGGSARDVSVRHVLANGPAPSISSGFGGSPLIEGRDEAFRVTAGSAPGSGGIITFVTAYTTAPVCHANDETTLNVILGTTPTTTQVTITVVSGTLLASDKIGVICKGFLTIGG